MDKYKIIKTIGKGAFGTVKQATNKSTGEYVAIKKMNQKFYTWQECLDLREIKSLKKLNHKNIVKIKEVIRANNDLYFIFEFCDKNVFELIEHRTTPLDEDKVRSIVYQTLIGTQHVHKKGFFHRDFKPENLLLCGDMVKVADFGLAR